MSKKGLARFSQPSIVCQKKPVFMTYAERDAPLALAPQRRIINESTNLGELFWKSLKRFESGRKRSNCAFNWGKLLNGCTSVKRFGFHFPYSGVQLGLRRRGGPVRLSGMVWRRYNPSLTTSLQLLPACRRPNSAGYLLFHSR